MKGLSFIILVLLLARTATASTPNGYATTTAASVKFSDLGSTAALTALVSSAEYVEALGKLQVASKKIQADGRGFRVEYKPDGKNCHIAGPKGKCELGEVKVLLRVNACYGDSRECDAVVGFISATLSSSHDGYSTSFAVLQAAANEVHLNCEIVKSGFDLKVVFQDFDEKWQTLDVFVSERQAEERIKELKKMRNCRSLDFAANRP